MKQLTAIPREIRRLVGSFAFQTRQRGLTNAIRDGVDLAWSMVSYPFVAEERSRRTFHFDGREYHYFVHHYNRAWKNERAVELAIGRQFLEERSGTRTLEVGNVMAHYAPVNYDVLDKYEISPGVINEDIVDHEPTVPYDTILSISTLEHVGWDEQPRQPDKTMRACHALRRMLAPEGELLLTCPIGQNPFLDQYISDRTLPFDDVRFMRRLDGDNTWVECPLEDVIGMEYGRPFANANAIFVGRMLLNGTRE
jgi:hypothetical protein